MFRKSRLAISTFAFFFFLTGALTHCVENSVSQLHASEIKNAGDDESVSVTESLHCPDALKVYAIGQRINLDNQKSSTVKQLANHGAAKSSKLTDDRFTSGISVGLSPSLLPYRLVPLYKLKDVYRI